MRMKKIVENRTLKAASAEFYAFKRAQKIKERTLHDYQRYIKPFVEQPSNSMDIDVLKREILEYFANVPTTSPARYNHLYQYLHALFSWCAKQDYLPYNPFDKLDLKKLKDEGNIKPELYICQPTAQFRHLLPGKRRRFIYLAAANGAYRFTDNQKIHRNL